MEKRAATRHSPEHVRLQAEGTARKRDWRRGKSFWNRPSASISLLQLRPNEFDDDGKNGHDDDAVDDDAEIVLHNRYVAEKITCGYQTEHPENRAGDVEGEELERRHERNARHKRRKRPHHRDKPGQNNGLAAVPFIESVSLEQVLLVQEPRLPVKNARSDVPSDFVVCGIPEHRRPQQDQQTHGIAEVPRPGNGSRREQQRIAGQKRRDHKTCFTKNNNEQKEIQHSPIFGDKGEQMLIDMQDKGKSLLQKRKFGHDGIPAKGTGLKRVKDAQDTDRPGENQAPASPPARRNRKTPLPGTTKPLFPSHLSK